MTQRQVLSILVSTTLLPAGLAVAALALRGRFGNALILYATTMALCALTNPPEKAWKTEVWTVFLSRAARRVYILLVLTTLNALHSCPTWFLAFLIATTVLQGVVYLLVPPSRLAPAEFPQIASWNSIAQGVGLGLFLCDFVLIQNFPANFRFSTNFHLAGYSLLTTLLVMQLAHDFYRLRRPLLYWVRALAFS